MNVDNDDEFVALLNQLISNTTLSKREMVDELCISPPTLERWLSGTSAPVRFVRSSVIELLEKHQK